MSGPQTEKAVFIGRKSSSIILATRSFNSCARLTLQCLVDMNDWMLCWFFSGGSQSLDRNTKLH